MLKRVRVSARRFLFALATALPLLAAAAPQLLVPFTAPAAKSEKPHPFKSQGVRVQFNLGELRNLVPGQEAELTLPDGSKHSIVLDLVEDKGGGITSWVGHYKGATPILRTIVTTGPGGSFGRITTPDNEYSIVPGPGDGSDWLVDMKAERPFHPRIDLREDQHVAPRSSEKSLVAPQLREPQTIDLVPGVNTPAVPKSASQVSTPSPQVVVDVLMLYTTGLAADLGSNLQTRLQQLITSANTIFADSGVAVTMRMVGSAPMSYTDTGDDSTSALYDITPGVGTVNAAFSTVESLRTQYGADMVTLLRDGDAYGGDGVAWVGGQAPNASFMYSVMTGCTASCDWVWVHELGHNFGNAHDRATNAWENGGSNVAGAYPYSFGYYHCNGSQLSLTCAAFSGACPTSGNEPECNTPESGTNNFSDIMAYFQGSTLKNMVFSNPAVTCQGDTGPGLACGSAAGNSDQANAALTINNTRVAMSQIKPTVIALTVASTTTLASSLNPSVQGQSVTFTATVTGSSGTPTGSVAFKDGNTTISACSSVALAAGVATCTISTLAAGSHSISAAYGGSTTYASSTSPIVAQAVVAKPVPAMTLTTSGNYAPVGTTITFTVTVSGTSGTPTGTVTITDTTRATQVCVGVVLSSGRTTCSTAGLLDGDHAITATYSGDATYAGASASMTQSMLNPPPAGTTNVALASNGGTASASSQYTADFPVSAIIDGDENGLNWGAGGGWADGTLNAYPDWAEVDFNGPKSIQQVVVITVQDSWQNPVQPTDSMTFTQSGIVNFTVQGWNGSAWQTLATVTGNNLVKRTLNFAAFTTTKIRVNVTSALNGLSRIVELEAWGSAASSGPATPNVALASSVNPSASGQPVTFTAAVSGSAGTPTGTLTFNDGGSALAGCSSVALSGGTATCTASALAAATHSITAAYSGDSSYNAATSSALTQTVNSGTSTETNFALASNGGVVSASSQWSSDFPIASINDGDRKGTNWGAGGGWADGTLSTYPDWAEVDFPSAQTLDKVVVYTVQDNWQNPVEPTDTMTFTQSGIVSFTVQAWNGSAWQTIGTVANNNLVKRAIPVSVTTSRIRINVTSALNGLSRIVELEAWGSSGGSSGPATPNVALASSANPSASGASVTFTATVSGSAGTPTGSVTFDDGGTAIGSCSSVALSGGTATCTASALADCNHSITAAYSGDSSYNGATSAAVSQTVGASTSINVALASNGGVASASSQWSSGFPIASINDGDRKGINWGAGGGWADGTLNAYPDWAEVDFPTAQTLDKVVVYTVQDNWQNPVDPSDTLTFTQSGIVNFTVQAWTGSTWQTIATVANNNLVKRTIPFAPFTTSKIRVNVTNALNGLSRIVELEAWTAPAGGGTNWALASNGGVATASSQYSPDFPISSINDGDRKGTNWGAGGGWADGTLNAYPDWAEVDFAGPKALYMVNVYTVQDNWQSPAEPSDTLTFTQSGIVNFTVQAWTGSTWQTIATVTNNNLVKRSIPVSVTTQKIRISVTKALNSLSRITEIEAFGS